MTQSQTNSEIRRSVKRIPLTKDEPSNLAQVFVHAFENHPRDNVLNYKQDGNWISVSTSEMRSRIENIAAGLYSIGVRSGDRAAILASNSPDWTITDAGCQFAGVIDVPIYTTLTSNSIQFILKDSGAKVLFVEDSNSLDRLKEILTDCEFLETVVLFNGGSTGDEKIIGIKELETRGAELISQKENLISECLKRISSDDIATLIYTSGTTGEPKGVMLSHENLLSNVIDAGEKFGFTANDVPLSVLPLSHVFERTGMYLYIYNGMAVHYAESIEKVADNMQEVRPTIFVGVPRIFEKVYARAKLMAASASPTKERVFDWAIDIGKEYALRSERNEQVPRRLAIKHTIADKIVFSKLRDFFGGRLRCCITGGAALSNSIYLIFTGAGISIMQGYGLTETSPVVATNNPINYRLGTVGKPIRNVDVRIATDGEIEVSGPNVMLGYYNRAEATRDAFTDDGWFKTGDIGKLDQDNFLRITDRKKELFKTSGGKYIAPSPIEQMIKGSRFVNQVVLIGNSRKFASALIVPNFEQLENFAANKKIEADSATALLEKPGVVQLFESEVERHCEGLARFETVKKIILLDKELTVEGGELTPTLKIKRRVIDEKYVDLIDKIYEELY